MRTIILWLMITPGNWEVFEEIFSSHKQCMTAEEILIKAVFKKDRTIIPERIAVLSIYKKGSDSAGIMWFGCHR